MQLRGGYTVVIIPNKTGFKHCDNIVVNLTALYQSCQKGEVCIDFDQTTKESLPQTIKCFLLVINVN